MTTIHDLKLGSNTLEVLEAILGSLEAFPDEIAKLDLSKFTKIAGDIDKSYQNIQSLGVNVTSMKEAISQTKHSIDEIKRDFDSKISTFAVDLDRANDINSSVNSAKNWVADIKSGIDLIKSSVDNSLTEFNGKNAVFNSKANKVSSDIESFNAFARSVNASLEAIKDEVNASKDEFSSKAALENIKLDSLKREVTTLKEQTLSSKNELDITLIQANTLRDALTYEANRANEVLGRINSKNPADEIYIFKGDIVHSNAKLSSQSLALTLATGVSMLYRFKYEKELPKLRELQSQYQRSNELAEYRLGKLDLLPNEADRMVRNSEFYSVLGVMV
ncbi:hypothetical protein [Campylobacter porcelli]|uniref:Uncharacterized protein n=1 Tax=Campylobacter porcelli TaxID=1660073 RepID=A0ABU7M4N9_9BACT|nr:hypothetical protein [Campylobacter sp. CX2-4855-23]